MGDALRTDDTTRDPPFPAAMLRVILRLVERLLVERGVQPWDQDRLEELARELAGADPVAAIRSAAAAEVEVLSDDELQRLRFFAEELYESDYWHEPSDDSAATVAHDALWAEIDAA